MGPITWTSADPKHQLLSYNFKVRPCSNTPVCLHTVYMRLYLCSMAHICACLSTPVHALPRPITSPCTHCPGLCWGRGWGPNLRSSDQRATCLTSSKPLHTADCESNPRPGLSCALRLCGPACMLQAVTCVTRGWTQAAHVNHTLMRQTLKHVDQNYSWPSSSLMHAHNILCLTRTCSEWRGGNHLLNVHFF